MLYFERRRSQVESELRRVKRPRKRYADLRLSAVLGRTESACCRTARGQTEAPAPADGCLMASLELQVMRAELGLARMERWLSQGARARAEAEAEDRFRAISAEVESELTSDGLLDPPPAAAAPPEADAARCTAITRKGARCRNAAKTKALCPLHARMHALAEGGEVDAGEPVAQQDETNLPKLDLPALRERLPKFRVATPNVRLPRLDVPRLGAGAGWAVGSSAALAVAFALIWSGLADSGGRAPGEDLTVALDAAPRSPLGAPGAELHRDAVLASVERRDPGAGERAGADAGGTSRGDAGGSVGAAAASAEAAPASGVTQPATVPVADPAPAPAPGSSPAPAPAPSPDGGGGTGTDEPEPEPDPSPSGQVGETVANVGQTASQLVDTLAAP